MRIRKLLATVLSGVMLLGSVATAAPATDMPQQDTVQATEGTDWQTYLEGIVPDKFEAYTDSWSAFVLTTQKDAPTNYEIEFSVSGNTVSGNTVSENTVSGNTVSGNTVSGNTVSGNEPPENPTQQNAPLKIADMEIWRRNSTDNTTRNEVMFVRGLTEGETGVKITLKAGEETAEVTVPVVVKASIEKGCAFEDAGFYRQVCFADANHDFFVTEEEMKYTVTNNFGFDLDLALEPAIESGEDFAKYLSDTIVVNIRGESKKPFELSYLLNTDVTGLAIDSDSVTNWSALASSDTLTELRLTMTDTPDLSQLSGSKSLKILYIGTDNLNLNGLGTITSLEELDVRSQVKNSVELPDLSSLTKLKDVMVVGGKNLSGLEHVYSLESLSFNSSDTLESLEPIKNLSGLKNLYVNYSKNLTDISAVTNMPLLETLDISGCTSLTDVSAISNLTNMKTLYMSSCGASTADKLAAFPYPDREMYVGEKYNFKQYASSVFEYSLYPKVIPEDTSFFATDYSGSKALKAGETKMTLQWGNDPALSKTCTVYIKEYKGDDILIGELLADENLPELVINPYTVGTVWDKAGKQVIDVHGKSVMLENVADFAGAFVNGLEEAGADYLNDSAKYYLANMALTEDGKLYTWVRQGITTTGYYAYVSETEMKESGKLKLHPDFTADNVKKLQANWVLTNDGKLYYLTSRNEFELFETGVADVMTTDENRGGTYYIKNGNVYNTISASNTLDAAKNLDGFVGNAEYAVSRGANKTYSFSGGEMDGILKQYVKRPVGSYYLFEDGKLYSEIYSGAQPIKENVASIHNYGYIDSEGAKYLYSGEEMATFEGEETYKDHDGLEIHVGKDGLYQNGQLLLNDVVDFVYMTDPATNYEYTLFAIRSDGSVWSDIGYNEPTQVYPIPAEKSSATAIAFTQTSLEMGIGERTLLELLVTPQDGDTGNVSYFSSDNSVASVTRSGEVTGKGGGRATIYAITEKGLRASCEVVVVKKLQGISLDKKEAELLEGETLSLNVSFDPADTSDEKKVTWKSSDESLVAVDEKGVVTAVEPTYGEKVTITATAVSNDTLTASCEISVIDILEEGEYVVPKDVTATLGVQETLSDLELPEGWNFDESDTVLTETGTHYYSATYKKEYCQDVTVDIPVLVNKVDKITITGSNTLVKDEEAEYSVQILTEGPGTIQAYCAYQWTSSNTAIVDFSAGEVDSTVKLLAKSAGKGKVTANLYLKDVNGETIKTYADSMDIIVTKDKCADDVQISLGEDGVKQGLSISDGTLSYAYHEEKINFTLQADCYSEGKKLENTAVKWATSDSSVVKLTTKNGVTSVVLQKPGTAVVTATAQDEVKATASLVIRVEEYAPRMEQKTITLNKALINGADFELLASYGATLSDVPKLYEKTKNGMVETVFAITKNDADNSYNINLKDSVKYADVKAKTYKNLYLCGTTTAGTYEIPVSVKVVAKLPSVSVKNTDKVNLFYTEDTGSVSVTATDAVIANVEYVTSAKESTLPQLKAVWNGETDSLFISQANITASNYKKAVVKGKLQITFEGYRSEAYGTKGCVEKTITLPKEYKEPQIELTATNVTLYEDLNKKLILGFQNKADKTPVAFDFWEVEKVDQAKAKNFYVISDYDENRFSLEVTGTNRTENVKIVLKKEGWLVGKACPLKVTLVKAGSKTVQSTLSAKKVTLNKNLTGAETATIKVSAPAGSMQNVETVTIYKNDKVYDGNEFVFAYDKENECITVQLTPNAAKGNHKFHIEAGVTSNHTPGVVNTGKLPLTISVITNAPKLSFKAKGSIDALTRDAAGVVLTSKPQYFTDEMASVEVTNENKKYFDVTLQADNTLLVQAKAGVKLQNKKSYPLDLKVTMENGYVFEKITYMAVVKQSTLKVKASKTAMNFYKSRTGEAFAQALEINLVSPNGASIEDITLTNYTNEFVYDSNAGKLYLKNGYALKSGKKYNLKFAVTGKDSCENVKPTTVTVKVTLNN